MSFDHVRVKLDDHGKGDIWINGQKLNSTFGFRIAAAAGYITRITIEIFGTVEYEGDAEVEINTHAEEMTTQEKIDLVEGHLLFADQELVTG